MNRGEAAYNFFLEGYNCTQSVLMAYRDFFPKDYFSLILDSSSSFGGGMGRLREVCGTVSGAFLILGRVYGYHEAKEREKKAKLYSHIQNFASLFEKENSSIICRDLLGLRGKSSPIPEERNSDYYIRRPCPGYCFSAASILEKYLQENGILNSDGEIIVNSFPLSN